MSSVLSANAQTTHANINPFAKFCSLQSLVPPGYKPACSRADNAQRVQRVREEHLRAHRWACRYLVLPLVDWRLISVGRMFLYVELGVNALFVFWSIMSYLPDA